MHKVVDRAIQVHGAMGVSDDTILSFFYRQERAARIYDGPDEVHKVVLSRRVLRGYDEPPPQDRVEANREDALRR